MPKVTVYKNAISLFLFSTSVRAVLTLVNVIATVKLGCNEEIANFNLPYFSAKPNHFSVVHATL